MMRVSVIVVTLSVLFQAAWISAKHIKGSKKNVGVYGGDFISIEDAPWMALLNKTVEDNQRRRTCAGTIVDRQFILTIDTCCNDMIKSRSDWTVSVATNGRTDGGLIVKVQGSPHPYEIKNPDLPYPSTTTQVPDHKFRPVPCLLKLEKPLEYDQKIQPVSLDEPSIVIEYGMELDFVAFGRPEMNNNASYGLRRSKLPIADWCKKENKRLDGGQICAGNREHNACYGDGGGALTSGRHLIGVLSAVDRDCRANAARFCRISFYRPWINKTIRELQ